MFIGLMDSSFWSSLLYVPTANKNNGITLATPYVAHECWRLNFSSVACREHEC